MVPYYIESYPVCPTYFFDTVGFYRIEKYLIDPMGILPQKVVLQGLGGVNCVEDLGDDPILLTTGKATDTIDHYNLSEVISMIDMGHGELEMLVEDLKGWGITTVRNSFSDSHETIDIDTFCQRAYDYCQTQEELDKWWNYSDEVLAQFFKRDNCSENSSPDDNNPEVPTPIGFEKLGFPTIAFASIPDEKKSSIVDELYNQLSSYITCSTEEFRYLVLPTYPKEFSYQPRIKWHTGSQQLMRAVFTHLFPAAVINSPNKSCCYCYIEEKGKAPKNFQLNKNIKVISAEDNLEAERIISNCYKAVGLQRPITKLSTDK